MRVLTRVVADGAKVTPGPPPRPRKPETVTRLNRTARGDVARGTRPDCLTPCR